MKAETAVAIINSTMWLGVSAAVIAAIISTGRLSAFWFFLIPAFSGVTTSSSEKERP